MTENILNLESKERFRRKLLMVSRVVALFFVAGIFFVGFVQIKYVREVNEIRSEYGSLGYCYMCGIETARSCTCNYQYDLVQHDSNFDRESYLENIASSNVQKCEDRNNKGDSGFIIE